MEIGKRIMRTRGWLLSLLLGLVFFWPKVDAEAAEVGIIHIQGPISPATADYISRSIDAAAEQNFQCLIIQLDTPGGLLDSTKDIVRAFYGAKVPVVVYVAPAGAYAGSAGVFITLAAHVAAMAPDTGIGAAHPVALGGGQADEVMKEKMVNFAVSYIETIAKKRGRNIEWAKSAVRESAAITAETALATNVIDLIALDLPELLEKLDGRQVDDHQLQTASAKVREIPMLLRERFFQMFWRPEVMFILMLVAIYGILGELGNPGAIFPGVVGAIALILVLYMAAVLPVNIAGIALLVLAVALFIAEIFTPSFGLLTAGGIAAFIFGSMMLFDTPAFRVPLRFIIPGALLTAVFFLFMMGAGLRAQLRPVRAGRETLLGKITKAETLINQQSGTVFVEGEIWNAVSENPVEAGQLVEIIGIEGLTLKVKPKT